MAGIIVPVAIHLWNNKQGKVLAIGSIAFLEKNSLKKARSRKVSEWWLLLLRCLLLMLLAFLLAGPSWKRGRAGAEKKGWVLVGENPVGGALTGRLGPSGPVMDSLIKIGFERHVMTDSSWWADFAVLDRQAPAGVPFYVFTDGRLQHFQGQRPVTGRTVSWQVDPLRDSAVHWTEQAWPRGSDSIEIITGSSGPTGTSYHHLAVGRQETPTVVDTTTLRVGVYTDDKYSKDGQWVAAAIRALGQFTRRNIMVTSYKLPAADGPAVHADWVFWLSSQPLPAGLKAANVLFYEPGREVPVDTWVRGSGVPVEKVIGQAAGLQPIWVDGFGRPLLALEETAGSRRYHFFSHFDPAWNGLVWSGEFPARMGELVLGGLSVSEFLGGHDLRAIDPDQVTPARGTVERNALRPEQAAIDLAPVGWLLIFLTLLAERILSFKRSNNG